MGSTGWFVCTGREQLQLAMITAILQACLILYLHPLQNFPTFAGINLPDYETSS